MSKTPLTEDQLNGKIEQFVLSYLQVEYGMDGLAAARDAYQDMELESEGVSFIGFILQNEEGLAESVVEVFCV
jgi:hypothetical protein